MGDGSFNAGRCGHCRIQLSIHSRGCVILLWDRKDLLEKSYTPVSVGRALAAVCTCPRVSTLTFESFIPHFKCVLPFLRSLLYFKKGVSLFYDGYQDEIISWAVCKQKTARSASFFFIMYSTKKPSWLNYGDFLMICNSFTVKCSENSEEIHFFLDAFDCFVDMLLALF